MVIDLFLLVCNIFIVVKNCIHNIFTITLVLTVIVLSSCKTKQKTATNSNNQLKLKYAEKLKVSHNEISNINLYSFIDEWYGVKYKYGGTTKSGVDCSGFCNVLYGYVYNKQLPRTTKSISKKANKVAKKKLKEGDLVFFDIAGKKKSHVGIYLINNYFVHASTSKGVIISSLLNPYYKKSFNTGGRL